MRISPKLLDIIRHLLQGGTISYSSLSTRLREDLLHEGLLTITAHGSRKNVRANNIDALSNFLNQYEALRGIDWKQEDNAWVGQDSRSSQAGISGNSKLRIVRSCPGFMVNSYEPIQAMLNGGNITIHPPEGTMLFVAEWQRFIIPDEVLIVGIENMENFRQIRRQRYLFEAYNEERHVHTPLLFVSRYPQSSDLRQWLMQIPNQYLHFGDFDLAGIRIFETEFEPYINNRATFFIPKDIEMRLQRGSAERFNAQYEHFKNYIPQSDELQHLANLIRKYHRCYDQEGYIK